MYICSISDRLHKSSENGNRKAAGTRFSKETQRTGSGDSSADAAAAALATAAGDLLLLLLVLT